MGKYLFWFIVIAIVFMILYSLTKDKKKENSHYILKPVFLKKYDIDIINFLTDVGYYPVPKVRIGDFIRATEKKMKYISPISSKSVDFLILNPSKGFSVTACIVYATNRRKEFIYSLCEETGIKCIVVPPYVTREELLSQINSETE